MRIVVMNRKLWIDWSDVGQLLLDLLHPHSHLVDNWLDCMLLYQMLQSFNSCKGQIIVNCMPLYKTCDNLAKVDSNMGLC